MTSRLAVQKLLVVGPGWLGAEIARDLVGQGAQVWTLQRGGGEHTAPFPTPLRGDIRDLSSDGWQAALPAQLDHVIVCIAPSRVIGDSHASTYPASVAGALQLAEAHGCRSVLYTSSTGVYARTDGSECREDAVLVSHDERQGALIAAEHALANEHVAQNTSRTILRVAGLYGPNRDPAPRFLKAIPAGDDDVWCNFAWRDDVVSAVRLLIEQPALGVMPRIVNCADGTPLPASAIARALGATATGELLPSRSSTRRSNQRIMVEKLRAIGWTPSKPTVFDGLRALGHIVQPEQRE